MSYTLRLEDDAKNEIISVPSVNLNWEFTGKLSRIFKEKGISKALFIDIGNGECFCPAGSIELAQKEGGIYYCQEGVEVYKLAGSVNEFNDGLIVMKVCTNPNHEHKHQNPKLRHQFSLTMKECETERTFILVRLQAHPDGTEKMIFSTGANWKKDLTALFAEQEYYYWWNSILPDGTEQQTQIFLSKEGVQNYCSKHEVPPLPLPNVREDYEVVFVLNERKDSVSAVFIETFMNFSIKSSTKGKEVLSSIPHDVLKQAFEYQLSTSGKNNLHWVKANILSRYAAWTKDLTDLVAPIASLSQGSGSGKSKLAVEIVKDGPGFYLVLRNDPNSSGYPPNNTLSKELISLVHQSDPKENLEKYDFQSRNVGKILFFFAKIITFQLVKWYESTLELLGLRPDDEQEVTISLENIDTACKQACTIFGKLFDANDEFPCDFISDTSSQAAYIRGEAKAFMRPTAASNNPTIDSLSSFIQAILNEPKRALLSKFAHNQLDSRRWIIEAMTKCLKSTPFIFVLDEADELSAISAGRMNGFENLRRAISYLKPGTKIFFLTLGTKSDVHDLNPVTRDNSFRDKNRVNLPAPIVLLSNSSVFSLNEYPIKDLQIDASILTNPVFFKFLVTLGHPLWSSLPFDKVVAVAAEKIINGSATTLDYIPVLWMIRTGLLASPTDLNTRTLIASHMATLFDYSPDLMRMTVFYPSEPILAIACRRIMSDTNFEIASLFGVLIEMFETIHIDRGDLAELAGSMLVLMAIDRAEKSLLPYDSSCASDRISELSTRMPSLEVLWRKNALVLEPEAEPAETINEGFPDYHVVTVRSFLKSLLTDQEFAKIERQLPETTLNGIINASHCVSVSRINGGFKFGDTFFYPMTMPVADSRISDGNCNVIDEAMLKYGLIHQCMFSMPPRYFGYDLISPVVLEDGSLTYIGIQFKAGNISFGEPIVKMQQRFHFVKCTGAHRPDCCLTCRNNDLCSRQHVAERCLLCINRPCPAAVNHNPAECVNCLHRKKLASLYANQISLLIVLDSAEETQRFASGLQTAESFGGSVKALKRALSVPNEADAQGILKSLKPKSASFTEPLISWRQPFHSTAKAALISSLWSDDNVGVSFIDKGGSKIPFVSDGFVHRQYCIATRGIGVFSHLLSNQPEAIQQARTLVNRGSHFFDHINENMNIARQASILKAIMYDASANYLSFNHVLAHWRGLHQGDEFGFPALQKEIDRMCVDPVTSMPSALMKACFAGETLTASTTIGKKRRWYQPEQSGLLLTEQDVVEEMDRMQV